MGIHYSRKACQARGQLTFEGNFLSLKPIHILIWKLHTATKSDITGSLIDERNAIFIQV